jgi:hypothetical protein
MRRKMLGFTRMKAGFNPTYGLLFPGSRVPRNSPLLRLALRAIGCADVRSGVLPPQSESRFPREAIA